MKTVFFLIPFLLLSQDILKMESYLKLLNAKNIKLKIEKNKIKINTIKENEAYYNFLPKIDFSYGTGLKKNNTTALSSQENPVWNKNLSLNWTIFNSGKNFDYLKIAKSNKKIAKYDFNIKFLELKSKAIALFVQVYKLQSQLEFLKNSLILAKKNIEKASLLKSLGKALKIDILSFELSLQERKNSIDNVNMEIKNTFFEMSQMIDKDLDVSKVIIEIDIPKKIKNMDIKELISYYQKGFSKNSNSLKKMEQNKKLAQYNLNLSLKNFIPSLGIRYSYSPYTDNFYSFPLDTGHSIFLTLNFNIFNAMKDYTNRKKQKLEVSNTNLEFKELISEKELLIKKLVNTFKNSIDLLEASKLALDLSKEKLEQIKTSYSVGKYTYLEVLKAENDFLSKENDVINLKTQIYNSYYQLELLSSKN